MKVYLRHFEHADGECIGDVSPADVGPLIATFRELPFADAETDNEFGMSVAQIVVGESEPFLEIIYGEI